MSTTAFTGKGSSPGDRHITPGPGGEPGDLTVYRDLIVHRNLRVEGDFDIIGTTDRILSDTYNHEDPELLLNSEYTGGLMPDIGIRAYRGTTYADGVLKFYSTLPGGYWGAGTVGDIAKIARVDLGVTTPNALYYDTVAEKIVHNSSVFLEAAQLRTTIPLQIDTAVNYSTFSNTVPAGSTVMGVIGLSGTVTGEGTKTSLMGFKDVTYDGTAFAISPTLAGSGSLLYEVTGALDDRTQHIFNDYLAIGEDDSLAEATYPTLINSDVLPMRLEASDALYLKVDDGGEGADGPLGQLIIEDGLITFTVPISIAEIIVNKVTTQALAYQIPAVSTPSFKPIPDPVGWFTPNVGKPGWYGSITYNATTYIEGWTEYDNRTKYEAWVDMTIAGGDPGAGTTTTMVIPIDIGGDIDNIRNLYGVVQNRTGGGGTVEVYPLPSIDIKVIPSFELDPTYLTAAFLTAPINYFFLEIRYQKTVGIWRWIVTVETVHPAITI